RIVENGLALFDIGAFEADDQRNREVHVLRRLDDTVGDDAMLVAVRMKSDGKEIRELVFRFKRLR
ncbi:MAG: hypothetical protein VX719_02240, partial [Pseudomonadota bacterium]|nr:hypothetical protein [Pseudomonadota bacterium]